MRFLFFALVLVSACTEAPTETVDDAAPVSSSAASQEMDPETRAAMEAATDTVSVAPVQDVMPEAAGPEVVARGAFSGASGHDVTGEALLYRLDDGSHLVRLEGFATDNGPALEVWLIRRTSGDIARGGASLGALKSTNGNQNYPVPSGIAAEDFAGVSVWCERFSVNFGTAPLE